MIGRISEITRIFGGGVGDLPLHTRRPSTSARPPSLEDETSKLPFVSDSGA